MSGKTRGNELTRLRRLCTLGSILWHARLRADLDRRIDRPLEPLPAVRPQLDFIESRCLFGSLDHESGFPYHFRRTWHRRRVPGNGGAHDTTDQIAGAPRTIGRAAGFYRRMAEPARRGCTLEPAGLARLPRLPGVSGTCLKTGPDRAQPPISLRAASLPRRGGSLSRGPPLPIFPRSKGLRSTANLLAMCGTVVQ